MHKSVSPSNLTGHFMHVMFAAAKSGILAKAMAHDSRRFGAVALRASRLEWSAHGGLSVRGHIARAMQKHVSKEYRWN